VWLDARTASNLDALRYYSAAIIRLVRMEAKATAPALLDRGYGRPPQAVDATLSAHVPP
jgi:hypothetical protein